MLITSQGGPVHWFVGTLDVTPSLHPARRRRTSGASTPRTSRQGRPLPILGMGPRISQGPRLERLPDAAARPFARPRRRPSTSPRARDEDTPRRRSSPRAMEKRRGEATRFEGPKTDSVETSRPSLPVEASRWFSSGERGTTVPWNSCSVSRAVAQRRGAGVPAATEGG